MAVHVLDNTDVLSSNIDDGSRSNRNIACLLRYKPRLFRSRGAILVLFLCILLDAGDYSVLNNIAGKIFSDTNHDASTRLYWLIGNVLLGSAIPQLFYPLAGWIADARIGRYKVIEISLWLVCIGHCVLFFPFLFLQLIDKAKYVYYIFPLAYLVINAGLAGFRTNIIQFGMDQMVDASGSQQSAYIHWYYWTTFAGSATASVIIGCLFPEYPSLVIGVGINVLFMGTALFCWYCLNEWLIKEPISENPFKTVYQVLKFSSTHKAPIHRSALTYWDDTMPSRLDLGKSKYGGPFSTEDVEDVKTFFATALVLISLGGFIMLNYSFESLIIQEMNDPKLGKFCTIGDLIISENLLMLLAIPIYELLIYPAVRNYTPPIMKRIGIGIFINIAAVLSALILDCYMNLDETSSDGQFSQCIFEHNITADSTPSALAAIPMVLDATAKLLVTIAALEFIFAQSPYGMRSMLVGTYYTIHGVFAMASAIIPVTLSYSWHRYQSSWKASCGTVYYSVMALVGFAGFVAYIVTAIRYKKRERDEHIEQYTIVENYYSKQVEERYQEN